MPIVNLSRDVVAFQGVPVKVLEGPREAHYIAFATERVRSSRREPGPPDAGPFFNRFASPLIYVVGAMLVLPLAVAIRARRRLMPHRAGGRDH